MKLCAQPLHVGDDAVCSQKTHFDYRLHLCEYQWLLTDLLHEMGVACHDVSCDQDLCLALAELGGLVVPKAVPHSRPCNAAWHAQFCHLHATSTQVSLVICGEVCCLSAYHKQMRRYYCSVGVLADVFLIIARACQSTQ